MPTPVLITTVRLERLHERRRPSRAKNLHRRSHVRAKIALHERLLENRRIDRTVLQPVIVPGSLSSATTLILPMSPLALTATAAAGPSYEYTP